VPHRHAGHQCAGQPVLAIRLLLALRVVTARPITQLTSRRLGGVNGVLTKEAAETAASWFGKTSKIKQ
jgi:hypothetical protein